MGPYCNFCGNRCFVPMSNNSNKTPLYILDAYRKGFRGTIPDIIATCEYGKKYEKDLTGYNFDDILKAVSEVEELERTYLES